MINKSILTLMMFLLAANLKSQSKVEVEFNPNIATYSIVEYLVAKHQGRLFYIDGKRTSVTYLWQIWRTWKWKNMIIRKSSKRCRIICRLPVSNRI